MANYRVTLQVTVEVDAISPEEAGEIAAPYFVDLVCERDCSLYDIDTIKVEQA